MLKERLRAMGCPIFIKGKGGQTIDFHNALDTLINEKGVKIPELANLQLIHEERNVIQHKGATVSPEEAEFYVKEGFDFLKRFSKDELKIDLESHIDKKNIGAFDKPQQASKTLSKVTEAKESNITALLLNYRELEVLARAVIEKMGYKKKFFTLAESIDILQSKQFKIRDPEKIKAFIKMRHQAAHTEIIPTKKEIEPLIDEARNLKFRLKRYLSKDVSEQETNENPTDTGVMNPLVQSLWNPLPKVNFTIAQRLLRVLIFPQVGWEAYNDSPYQLRARIEVHPILGSKDLHPLADDDINGKSVYSAEPFSPFFGNGCFSLPEICAKSNDELIIEIRATVEDINDPSKGKYKLIPKRWKYVRESNTWSYYPQELLSE